MNHATLQAERRFLVCWLVALTCALGCRRAPDVPAPPAAEDVAQPGLQPTETSAQAKPDATAANLPDAPTLTEAEARGLLEKWKTTQESGDFDAYGVLYAPRMTGVRRTGVHTRRLDRAGWLADRRKMFAKAMTVEIADVTVRPAPGMAQVRFTQTFTTGTFRDVGPKLMVLIRDGQQVRIAREEMLASQVLDAAEVPQAPPFEQLALAYRGGGQTWLIVGPPEGVTPTTSPTLIARQGPASAVRLAELAKGSLWLQRDVVLFGAAGEVCRGQVDGAGQLARMIPHFERVQDWNGSNGTPRWSDADVAREIWDQSRQAAKMAVRIRPYRGDCAGAVWGRASNLPLPKLYDRSIAPGGYIREDPLAAMRALKSYQAIQREYQAQVPAPRPAYWDELNDTKAEVRVFAGHGQRIALVHTRAGDFCGGFGGDLLAAWWVTEPVVDQLRLQLVTDDRAGDLQLPECAADVDGDGQPELIGPTQIWRRIGPVWRPAMTLDVPDFDCPC